jgi:hypothetical protein
MAALKGSVSAIKTAARWVNFLIMVQLFDAV